MKALSTTILIVVTAVVILVAALVLLTIFGGGVGNVAQMTTVRNNCIIQCSLTCKTMNQMPPTWSATCVSDKITPVIDKINDCKCTETSSSTTPSTPTSSPATNVPTKTA